LGDVDEVLTTFDVAPNPVGDPASVEGLELHVLKLRVSINPHVLSLQPDNVTQCMAI
jgi:hypothetical protein